MKRIIKLCVILMMTSNVYSQVQSSMKWVLLTNGTTNGSCSSNTDCDANKLCYGLEYTPGFTGALTSYTTGFFGTCVDGNANVMDVAENTSCTMVNNSTYTNSCATDNVNFFNSSGNTGTLTVTAGTPLIVHQVCFIIPPGGSLTITEDDITDLTAGIDSPDGTPNLDKPSYSEFTIARDVVCPLGNPSPVSYTSFEANRRNSVSELTWTTESENNNSHFDIERSVDGRSWTTIGKVEGNGTSKSATDYRFIDDAPMADNYYRLKQVDFNGRHEYSDTRYVRFANIKDVAVYPNPFLSDLTIGTGGYTGSIALEVRDVNGKALYREIMDTRTVDLSQLEAGVYMIHVQDSNGGLLLNQRIIKVD